ncbi:hypothetical protein K435DRAFT_793216 [Dendrothele bispora CBS 962.96]|uniref:Uncharacterized protein n=1 Tax=Dendrothele bispora (strain CBS 962.96) TaxID=1314807 RepID=A0A4S8MG60_DENBC|nr:hypothetical protein K435DRAFT_793216 [Dendrothele bispora CBS 962.96]
MTRMNQMQQVQQVQQQQGETPMSVSPVEARRVYPAVMDHAPSALSFAGNVNGPSTPGLLDSELLLLPPGLLEPGLGLELELDLGTGPRRRCLHRTGTGKTTAPGSSSPIVPISRQRHRSLPYPKNSSSSGVVTDNNSNELLGRRGRGRGRGKSFLTAFRGRDRCRDWAVVVEEAVNPLSLLRLSLVVDIVIEVITVSSCLFPVPVPVPNDSLHRDRNREISVGQSEEGEEEVMNIGRYLRDRQIQSHLPLSIPMVVEEEAKEERRRLRWTIGSWQDSLGSLGRKEKVTKLIAELRELAVKGQATDPSRSETQQASLGLFPKGLTVASQIYEKRNAENNSQEKPSEPASEKD